MPRRCAARSPSGMIVSASSRPSASRARPAEAGLRLGVPAGDHATRVDRDEGVVRRLDDLARPVIAALQGRLDHPALGDVARRGVDQPLLDDGHRAPFDPAPAAVLGREAVDEVDGDAARAQLGRLLLGARAIVVVDELHEGARAQLVLAPSERLRPRGVELLEVAVEARRADEVAGELEVARAAPELRLHVASQTPVPASPAQEADHARCPDRRGEQVANNRAPGAAAGQQLVHAAARRHHDGPPHGLATGVQKGPAPANRHVQRSASGRREPATPQVRGSGTLRR